MTTDTYPRSKPARPRIEWPTLWMLVACYAAWGLGTAMLPLLSLPAAIVLVGVATALYASLCHEVTHGHPTRSARINAALVFPALTLFIPFDRFRDTHLAHHRDANLTDPYDDPETNFLDPVVWETLPRLVQWVLRLNNALLGRMILGPVLGTARFLWTDATAIARGDRSVANAWLWHIPAVALVLLWLRYVGAMPIWAYLLATYLAFALLRIRVFLEHRAHTAPRARTVIVEDRGPLSLLFLNNNLHVVHHMHPGAPWYDLPRIYARNRAHYLRRNESYRYRSYAEIFRRYLLRAKDPVAHPLRPGPVTPQTPSQAPRPPAAAPEAALR